MGENKDIKKLDDFTKKYIKEIEIESPSVNFTANLMDTILQKEKVEVYKATPLISTKIWFVLVGVLMASILYVSKGSSLKWIKIPELNFDFLSEVQMPNLFEGFVVSNTILYACFFFTIMFFGQVYMLKNHFTKEL